MTPYFLRYDDSFSRQTLRQIVIALACALFYSICIFYFATAIIKADFLPVTGLAIAVILRNRKFDLIGVFAGVWLAQHFVGHDQPLLSGLSIIGGVFEAVFGAVLLSSYSKFDVELTSPQGFLYLFLVCLVTPVISTLFFALALSLHQVAITSNFLATINQYWMGDSLGILLWVSLILIWHKPPYNWQKMSRRIEFAALVLLSFVVGQIIFYGWFSEFLGSVSRGYWMFLIILIGAIRLGRHGVILLLIIATAQALMGALAGKGYFANDVQNSHLVNLWNYIATLTMVGMMFSIVLKNRLTNELKLRQKESQLLVTQKLAGIASWTWDLQTGRHWWDKEIYELYGRDPALGAAIYPEVKKYFTAESWKQLSAAVKKCTQSGESYECDAEVVRSDGTHRWIIVRGESERDNQGEVLSIYGTVQDITERKTALLRMATSEANFRGLFENSPTAMVAVNPASGQILQANSNAIQLWGYPAEELLEMTLHDITHPEDVVSTHVILESCACGEFENGYHFQKRYVKKNGLSFWGDVTVSVVRDEAGRALYNLGSIIDITESKRLEQELLHLSMAVEQSPESIVITNTEAVIEYVNEAYLKTSGFSREELLGKNSRVVQSGSTPRATYESLWQTLKRGETWEGEFINRTKSGVEYTEHAIISPIRRPDGCITHYVAVKEDITEKLRSKKQLHRLAYFDEITDLPNFVMLQEHINQQIQKSRQYGAHSALLTLNLDRFKTVNDANGQALSNLLLKQVGSRLVQHLHSTDVVSRTSGDEFCILLPDIDKDLSTAAHLVMQISQKLHACMRNPFYVGGNEVILSACHGIVLFTGSGDDNPFDVIRRSNTALHHAKSKGCEQSVFFERSLEQLVQQRFVLEGDLRHALKHGEFDMYLQSQVDDMGQVKGAEALIRWKHPTKGLISPAQFIPIAEETNLIIEIDNWVLNQICQLIACDKIAPLPIRFSVNISARHFNQPDFVEQIKEALRRAGADPRQLTLEITEGVVIGNIDDVIAKMLALSAVGIHFSMDDFGTGYSSLSYLKRLPIQELKIDKSFIQEVTTDANDAALVEVILAVAKHLKLKIVAEGVETLEQAAFLNQRAKVLHQGYLFSEPEPIASWVEKLLGHG